MARSVKTKEQLGHRKLSPIKYMKRRAKAVAPTAADLERIRENQRKEVELRLFLETQRFRQS